MGHGHHHGEARRLGREASRRRLGLALGLTLVAFVAEVAGGFLSNSLALLADAGHVLADAGALGLAAFASHVATRPADARRTYGHHRAEILAALANGAVLVAIAILIVKEAVVRMVEPEPIRPAILLGVATFGLALNIACLVILAPARGSGLNARAAFLHVVSDTLGSVAAMVGGVLSGVFGLLRADAAVSIVIAALVARSAWNLVREAVAVLMEGAPAHVDVDEVRQAMLDREGVREVHDLHVWSITSGMDALSGHVVVASGHDHPAVLGDLQSVLADRFHVHHVTLQLEPEGCDIEEHH